MTYWRWMVPAMILGLAISCTENTEPENTPTVEITYTADVKPIMDLYCTGCHSGTEPSGDVDLSTYANLKDATQNGAVIQRMNDGQAPMPPTGLLEVSQRDLIAEWADGGYLE
ncbi:hypothetical protein [Pontibacter sp. G13]|uniref:hypothetical protein n=1 Tax=Pontibacter sp. G13 TaxID=3074898 RepID=UPI002889BFEC|nr:hypothetical protein [Pontibacter sp. G13]WNJ20460.1 hypothetical protein RJD25_08260 [Pontibacter sp. G13]